jgi:hypothetical protein
MRKREKQERQQQAKAEQQMKQEHEHIELVLVLHSEHRNSDQIDTVGTEQCYDAEDYRK